MDPLPLPPQQQQQQKNELSEEDQQLKETLDMLVQRLQEPDQSLHRPALESLRSIIRSSTASMTSVPKPLKFLHDRISSLEAVYNGMKAGETKQFLADILSVLFMAVPPAASIHSVLRYRMEGLEEESVEGWGHEYVKHLAMEIAQEYEILKSSNIPADTTRIVKLALKQLVPFFLQHNSEPDACDLLVEIEQLDQIVEYSTKANYARICLYLASCVSYEPFPYNNNILLVIHKIYVKMHQYSQAIYVAIRLNDHALIKEDLEQCSDPIERKQMCYILSRYPTVYPSEFVSNSEDAAILNNHHYNSILQFVAQEFSLLDPPKTPEDIYKTYLDTRNTDPLDSPRVATANGIVNGLLNMGLCTDKYLSGTNEQADAWIYQPKTEGILSAVASIGAIWKGNVEGGLERIDRYIDSSDPYVKSGALLATGLLMAGGLVKNEADPALALLTGSIAEEGVSQMEREAALLGLMASYSGSGRVEVRELLIPILTDTSLPLSTVALGAVVLGNVFIGSCDGEVTSVVLQMLMERENEFMHSTFLRFMALSLGLLYYGKQEAADAAIEAVRVLEPSMALACSTLMGGCAYAGTGNVLQIQQFLHQCSSQQNQNQDEESESSTNCLYQSFAVLSIALVASGEEIGSEMVLRLFNHIMFYASPSVKKAIPLALALISASNPQMTVVDVLSKYSHDGDKDIAIGAVIGLGIVGGGTANSRIANLLRALANFYYKDPVLLGVVKTSQGILHASRGTCTLHPLTHHRTLMNPVAVGGLVTFLIALGDSEQTLFGANGKYPHLVYLLVGAMQPRWLVTVDESGTPVKVLVRVGSAVDTVGLAGKPKSISGFQTHPTPVLLGVGERAEIASEEWMSVSEVMEGIVVVKKRKLIE